MITIPSNNNKSFTERPISKVREEDAGIMMISIYKLYSKTTIITLNTTFMISLGLVQITKVLELECISVSSAYNETVEVWRAFDILLMWILNNVGPKNDPCGTPKERRNRAEIASLKTAHSL